MQTQKKLLVGILLFSITLAFSIPLAVVQAYSDPQVNTATYELTGADTLVMTVGGKKINFKLTTKSSATTNGVIPVTTPNLFTYQNGDLQGCPQVEIPSPANPALVKIKVAPRISITPNDAKSKPTGPINASLAFGNNSAGESDCPAFDNGSHAINVTVKDGVDITGLTAGATDTEGGDKEEADSCVTTDSGPLGWILCPIIDLGATFTGFVFESFVKPFLEDVPVTTDPEDPSYKTWKQFRVIGNIVLVGTMLAVVYAQVKGDR
jgi:hypothetical protein